MKIYLATDHAGFELKEKIKNYLRENNYDIKDCGAFSFDQNDDYPDFVSKASEKISNDPKNSMGIIFGGSGQAEMMVANKFKNIRCGLFYSTAIPAFGVDVTGRKSSDPYEMIRLIREHNNANMLSISSRFLKEDAVKKAIDIFLKTSFSGDDRHIRRIDKIREIEQKNYA
jgi:ribose 5-phosphate isomerase B